MMTSEFDFFKDDRKFTYLNSEGSGKPLISPVSDLVLARDNNGAITPD